jgi:phosphatidylserine decarboxylase
MAKIQKIKKQRLHREGTTTLRLGLLALLAVNILLYYFLKETTLIPFYIFLAVSLTVYLVVVNFFRCPIRVFNGETERTVVAPADGKIVVVEEVEENEYFHDRRKMVSIFMSVTNVHANWFPVEGLVTKVEHHNGNYHKAWLPKASTENERSTIVIRTAEGQEVLVRQVAGAVARRIVTYAHLNEECFIDEHLGFIKFGSRVDVYLPLDTDIRVTLGQATVGNQTVIGQLSGMTKS